MIFETNEVSFHGHPVPVRMHGTTTRKSLSIYYYTEGRIDISYLPKSHDCLLLGHNKALQLTWHSAFQSRFGSLSGGAGHSRRHQSRWAHPLTRVGLGPIAPMELAANTRGPTPQVGNSEPRNAATFARGDAAVSGGGGPAISVILVVDPNRASFPRGLEPFLEQTLDARAFELVVVDWEGGPPYLPILERARSHSGAPSITYLRSKGRGRAALNNLGVSRARAPILCFCADDFIPGATYVEAHLAYHTAHPEPTRVAIGAGIATDELRHVSPFLAWLEDSGELFGARFRQPSADLPAGYFYVANVSLKRSFVEQVGPFDERLPFPSHDDAEYAERLVRLGMVSELVPAARCIHDHLVTLVDRRRQCEWAGASAAILSAPQILAADRARHLKEVRRKAFRAWCEAARRDGPRIAWWRLSLLRAFLAAYRRQMASARDS